MPYAHSRRKGTFVVKRRDERTRRNGVLMHDKTPVLHLQRNHQVKTSHLGSRLSTMDMHTFLATHKNGHSPTKSDGELDTFHLMKRRHRSARREIDKNIGMENFDIYDHYSVSDDGNISVSSGEEHQRLLASQAVTFDDDTEEGAEAAEAVFSDEDDDIPKYYLRTQSNPRPRPKDRPLGFTSGDTTGRHPPIPHRQARKRRLRRKKNKNKNRDTFGALPGGRGMMSSDDYRALQKNSKENERRIRQSIVVVSNGDPGARNRNNKVPKNMQFEAQRRKKEEEKEFAAPFFTAWAQFLQTKKDVAAARYAMMERIKKRAAKVDEQLTGLSMSDLRLAATFSAWVDYHITYGPRFQTRQRAHSADVSKATTETKCTPTPLPTTTKKSAFEGTRLITLVERQAEPRPHSAAAKYVHHRPVTPFKTGRKERFDAAHRGIWHGNPHVEDHYGPEKRSKREEKGIKVMTRNMVKKVSRTKRSYTVPTPPRCAMRPTSAPMSTRLRDRQGGTTKAPEEQPAEDLVTAEITDAALERAFADLDILAGPDNNQDLDMLENVPRSARSSIRKYKNLYCKTRVGDHAENPNWGKAPVQYHSKGPGHKSRRLRRHQADPEFESMPRMAQVQHNMALLDHWFGIRDEDEEA